MTIVAKCRLDVGLSLKPEHFEEAHAATDPGLWFEVHTENYFVAGGPRLAGLMRVAERHPVSLHGVGASLGGTSPPDTSHLRRVARLVNQLHPVLVSEHAVWSSYQGEYLADLLPLPRTRDAMDNLVRGVEAYQEALGRTILLENPSNYLPVHSDMDEVDFLLEVASRTGCGLLLDISNLFISARNTGVDAYGYIRALTPALVGEIHVAGYDVDPGFGDRLLIDSHAASVDAAVWQMLDVALQHLGPRPVLLERDANLPAFSQLQAEANRARQLTHKWQIHHHE